MKLKLMFGIFCRKINNFCFYQLFSLIPALNTKLKTAFKQILMKFLCNIFLENCHDKINDC